MMTERQTKALAKQYPRHLILILTGTAKLFGKWTPQQFEDFCHFMDEAHRVGYQKGYRRARRKND